MLVVAALCAKCSSPTLYPLVAQVLAQLLGLEQGFVVGVRPIETLHLLDRNHIFSRSDTPKLEATGQRQWANVAGPQWRVGEVGNVDR